MAAVGNISAHTRQLVHAAQNGDRLAIEDLIHIYGKLVWWTVRSFRFREADAQDAVQNTWLRMIEHLGTLRNAAGLGGWLVTTARHECLDLLRRGRREVHYVDPWDLDANDQAALGPDNLAVERSMRELLWGQVAQLPSDGRTLITALTAPDSPQYAHFARNNGIPIGSIGPTRMRMLRKLRRQLEECGLGPNAWW